MKIEGVVDRRGKNVHKAGQLPPVVLADITKRDRDGELIAEPTEWDEEEHGPIPTIVIVDRRASRARHRRCRASATGRCCGSIRSSPATSTAMPAA